jgi:hypothetical protein
MQQNRGEMGESAISTRFVYRRERSIAQKRWAFAHYE